MTKPVSPEINASRQIASEFESPNQNPGFLLWRVSSAWQRQIKKALKPLGLTHAQFVLLASLGWLELQMQVNQTKLAGHIGADVMTTSSLVRSLEKRGLLTRNAQDQNARANILHLTKDGLAMVQQSIPLVEAADKKFFAGLQNSAVFRLELEKLIRMK